MSSVYAHLLLITPCYLLLLPRNMKNPERIIRLFERERRPDFIQIYPFTTFSTIWENPTGRPNLLRLNQFFRHLMIGGCPDASQKKSVSSGEPLVNVHAFKRHCDLVDFAASADYEGHGNRQHEIVQNHLLTNDVTTMAIEIPVCNEEWHGHIDIIRYLRDSDKIEVVDFKPKADKETKAAFQVYRYMKLLSGESLIPITDMTGRYFDNKSSYTIKF